MFTCHIFIKMANHSLYFLDHTHTNFRLFPGNTNICLGIKFIVTNVYFFIDIGLKINGCFKISIQFIPSCLQLVEYAEGNKF